MDKEVAGELKNRGSKLSGCKRKLKKEKTKDTGNVGASQIFIDTEGRETGLLPENLSK